LKCRREPVTWLFDLRKTHTEADYKGENNEIN